jgi:hypothetical protein
VNIKIKMKKHKQFHRISVKTKQIDELITMPHRIRSQDPEEELAASNLLTIGIRAQVSCSDRRARFCAGYGTIHVYDTIHKYGTVY